jgi:hypothetical protein
MAEAADAYTSWLVGAALAAVALGIAFILVRGWRSAHVPWQPLSGYYPGTKWYSRAGTDPRFLVEALQAAESFLIVRTRWTAANLALVGHYAHIFINDRESWASVYGDGKRMVAGTTDRDTIAVGPSLAALCHEMAHLCESVLDHQMDFQHAGWATNGVADACADFELWLTRRMSLQGTVAGVLPNPAVNAPTVCWRQVKK